MHLTKTRSADIPDLCQKLETACEEVIREQEARIAAECPGLLPVIEAETRGWSPEKVATLMACLAVTPLPKRPMIAFPSAKENAGDREGRYMHQHFALDIATISLYLLGAQGRREEARDVGRTYDRIHHAIRSAR